MIFFCSPNNKNMCLDEIKKINIDFNNIKKEYENDFIEFFDIKKFDRLSKKEGFITNNDVNFVSRVGKFDKNKYSGVL